MAYEALTEPAASDLTHAFSIDANCNTSWPAYQTKEITQFAQLAAFKRQFLV